MSALAITGSVTAVEEERATMASGLQIALNATLERQLKQLSLEFGMRIIEAIAKEYELDANEIVEKIGFDDISVARVKTTRKASTKTDGKTGKTGWNKPSIILPWTGERLNHPDFCLGIRKNYGLFSQCVMKRVGDGKYCATCQKQADKNPSGKPTAGDVEDRIEQGMCEKYVPPGSDKAIKVEGYANIIANIIKKNADKAPLYEKEAVIETAANFGITLDNTHFVPMEKKSRGRPKKSSDSEEENETMVEKATKRMKDAEDKSEDETMVEEASDLINEMIAEEETAVAKIAELAGYDEEVADDAEAIDALVEVAEEVPKTKKTSKKEKKVEKPKKFKYAGKEETLSGKAYANGQIMVTVDGEMVDLADMNFTFRDGDLYDENDKKVKKGKNIDALVSNIREQITQNEEDEDEE